MQGGTATKQSVLRVALTGLMRLRFTGHLCGCEGKPEWCKGPSTVARLRFAGHEWEKGQAWTV